MALRVWQVTVAGMAAASFAVLTAQQSGQQGAPQQAPAAQPQAAQPAADDPVQPLVARLDLERYKATIKGLTQFGDRRQGTDRNRAAVDWIEAQLKSYGCPTERIKYEYVTPQRGQGRGGRGRGGQAAQGNKR